MNRANTVKLGLSPPPLKHTHTQKKNLHNENMHYTH